MNIHPHTLFSDRENKQRLFDAKIIYKVLKSRSIYEKVRIPKVKFFQIKSRLGNTIEESSLWTASLILLRGKYIGTRLICTASREKCHISGKRTIAFDVRIFLFYMRLF